MVILKDQYHKFDDYFGVYCSNEFQRFIEANELTGMELRENLASYETQISTRM